MHILRENYKYFPCTNLFKGGIFMSQLSEKELASIQECLADEDLLVKKFKMLAEHATNEQVKSKMMEISEKHQKHFNELYSKLS